MPPNLRGFAVGSEDSMLQGAGICLLAFPHAGIVFSSMSTRPGGLEMYICFLVTAELHEIWLWGSRKTQ